jgi:hypothetical protein
MQDTCKTPPSAIGLSRPYCKPVGRTASCREHPQPGMPAFRELHLDAAAGAERCVSRRQGTRIPLAVSVWTRVGDANHSHLVGPGWI